MERWSTAGAGDDKCREPALLVSEGIEWLARTTGPDLSMTGLLFGTFREHRTLVVGVLARTLSRRGTNVEGHNNTRCENEACRGFHDGTPKWIEPLAPASLADMETSIAEHYRKCAQFAFVQDDGIRAIPGPSS
jgi:hypothetical protein